MSRGQAKRARQLDVARLAGVSQATVSIVLSGGQNGTARISEETEQRIRRIAGELGYTANLAARSLAGGANRLIGLFTFERVFPVDHHDFYYPFLRGIEAGAEEHGYDLILFASATAPDGQRSVYANGINRLALADGCILIGQRTDVDQVRRLREEGYPFALIGRRDVPGGGVDYVTAGYADATAQVVDLLVAEGHRRIAYLRPAAASEPASDRDEGFERASLAHGLAGGLDLALGDAPPTLAQVDDLLDRGATAFVVHDPVVAVGVGELLVSLGRRVPDDVSLACLADPPAWGGVRLAGFRIPRQAMGKAAVDLVVDRVAGVASSDDGAREIVLPCTLTRGATVGPAEDWSSL